ncbi:hypothetical protein FZEAL_3677 [Fusarium zealandicum]|uniref:Mating-type protein MAT-1 n=1 Tax=Fusarium zealandicum TaxID=1053134 RepID=A0A8H4XLJ5_9HYPO|nr:hypothetical protein FZEAL_3677 [Fusarium zealandicum]
MNPLPPTSEGGPQFRLVFPPTATNQDIEHFLAGSALRHLEPRPGGQWIPVSRSADLTIVKYTMNDGTAPLFLPVSMAATPKFVATICEGHLFEYPGDEALTALLPHPAPGDEDVEDAENQPNPAQMQPMPQAHQQAPPANNSVAQPGNVQGSGNLPVQAVSHAQAHHQAQAQVHTGPMVPQSTTVSHPQLVNGGPNQQQYAVDASGNFASFERGMPHVFQTSAAGNQSVQPDVAAAPNS